MCLVAKEQLFLYFFDIIDDVIQLFFNCFLEDLILSNLCVKIFLHLLDFKFIFLMVDFNLFHLLLKPLKKFH